MEVLEFKTKLFAKGLEAGFSDMEIYYHAERDTTVRVFKGMIDAYNIVEEGGLSFRGMFDGRMGYSYTEKLDEDSIDLLVREARENAEIIESNEAEELFAGSEQYTTISTSPALTDLAPNVLIDTALQMERVAYDIDSRIDVVNTCLVSTSESRLMISNTRGLDVSFAQPMAMCMLSAVAKENGDISSASDYTFTANQFADLKPLELAESAAKQAVSKLQAESVDSDNYTVILRNDAAADLLRTFASVFSGEAAERGLSLLQGRVGEMVAGANITIIDDPHRTDGPGTVPFDAEGVATAKHEVIQAGQLRTLLHNRKTAAKAGVATTGNAVKGTYRAPLSVAPTNLYIQPGEQTLDELIQGTARGLLLVDLQGLHAGANPVSGDFSLSCTGYLIENGQIVRAVNQITASGNFIQLLQNVEALGGDLRLKGTGRGTAGAPSMKIKSLSIAGK